MRWPPWRRHDRASNHRDVEQAKDAAAEQLRQAEARSARVDSAARRARDVTRRTDRFAREIEQAWHTREGNA